MGENNVEATAAGRAAFAQVCRRHHVLTWPRDRGLDLPVSGVLPADATGSGVCGDAQACAQQAVLLPAAEERAAGGRARFNATLLDGPPVR